MLHRPLTSKFDNLFESRLCACGQPVEVTVLRDGFVCVDRGDDNQAMPRYNTKPSSQCYWCRRKKEIAANERRSDNERKKWITAPEINGIRR